MQNPKDKIPGDYKIAFLFLGLLAAVIIAHLAVHG